MYPVNVVWGSARDPHGIVLAVIAAVKRSHALGLLPSTLSQIVGVPFARRSATIAKDWSPTCTALR